MDDDLPPFPPGTAAVAAGLMLRPAAAGDLDFLRHLYGDWLEAGLASLPWTAAQKRMMVEGQFRSQHRQFVERFDKADFWIVTDAGERPIGRLYLDRATLEWRLIDVLLDDAHRGRGFGTALIGWMQQEAQAAGASLTLNVAADNPRARALYRRLGFIDCADEADVMHRAMRWDGMPVR